MLRRAGVSCSPLMVAGHSVFWALPPRSSEDFHRQTPGDLLPPANKLLTPSQQARPRVRNKRCTSLILRGLMLILIGIVLPVAYYVWVFYQNDTILDRSVHVREGYSLVIPVHPRFTDKYDLELHAMYPVVIAGDDSLLGVVWGWATAADSQSRSQVDVAWSVRQGKQEVGGGIARGRNFGGLKEGGSFRVLGTCDLAAGRAGQLSVRFNRGSQFLDEHEPRLVFVRRANAELEVWALFGMLLLVVGLALVIWGVVFVTKATSRLAGTTADNIRPSP